MVGKKDSLKGRSLFERQIPIVPPRNCKSKFLGSTNNMVTLSVIFQRGNIGYYSNINVSNSGMWQSIMSLVHQIFISVRQR